MTSVSFPISRVNRLRSAAEQARALPDEKADIWERGPSGVWFTNAYDANNLIGVFDTLRLKAGFALHSFAVRSDGNGRGVIWAVPAGTPPPVPDDSPGLEGRFAGPQAPPGAIPLMQAIEGDGSPWSCLSASILRREAAEFGASWHGLVWSPQTILSKAPRQTEGREASRTQDYRGDAPIGDWTWHSPVPQTWEPSSAEEGTTRRVVLYIRDPVGGDTIYRATDTYRADSYDCETETTVVCTGPGGFVH